MKTTHSFFQVSIYLLAFSLYSTAHAAGMPALSKYSYPIFTVTGKQQFTGTAFFYRSGDTSFLVSNYHAIKGMNPLRQVISFTADTLYLKYPVKNTGRVRLLPIDIRSVTGETEIFSMVDRIDLLKIPVDIPADAEVFYINDLIDQTYFSKEPEEIIVFGYPTGLGSVTPFYSHQQKLQGKINPRGFADYDAAMRISFPTASDSARAIIASTSRYYYFIKPYAEQGYSGAPVFGKFRDSNNEVVYRFTGVVFAGQPATRQTWAIKPNVAFQYLSGEL
jgi:hypothetical protein